MPSTQGNFDPERARHEVFQGSKGNIWTIINFVVRTAKALIEQKRLHDFTNLLQSLTQTLKSHQQLKQGMLQMITLYAMERPSYDEGLLDYLLVLESLWDFSHADAIDAQLLSGIGMGYLRNDLCTEAIEYSNKAINIATKHRFTEDVVSACYENLGNTYLQLGQYKEAIHYQKKSLAIRKKCGNRTKVGSCYANLGMINHSLGNYEEAIQYLEKSRDIGVEERSRHLESVSYAALGKIYLCIGQNEKAIKYIKKSTCMDVELGNRIGEAKNYSHIGIAYRNLGNYEKAIQCFEKGVVVGNETRNRAVVANAIGNLGTVYCFLREFRKAVEHFEGSIAIYSETGDQPGLSTVYTNLGFTYFHMSQYEKAIQNLEIGLGICVRIEEKWGEAIVLANLGLSHYYLGLKTSYEQRRKDMLSMNRALWFLKESIKCSDRIFEEFVADKKKAFFTNEYFRCFTTLMSLFAILGNFEAALLVGDLGKAKALQSSMEKRMKSEFGHKPGYTQVTWQRINEEKAKEQLLDIEDVLHIGYGDTTLLLYSFDVSGFFYIWVVNGSECVTLKGWEKRDDIQLAREWVFRNLHELFSHFQVNLQRNSSFHELEAKSGNLQGIMSLDDKLVDPTEQSAIRDLFTLGNFMSEKGNTLSNCDSLKITPAEEKVQQDLAVDRALGYEILQKLFLGLINPVKSLLKGTKLIIVPESTLFFVPFCSLLDDNGLYLSESYSIQITPSIHTLYSSVMGPRHTSLGPALFVGNPAVGKVSFEGEELDVPPLPYATKEVECLASRFDAKPIVEHEAYKSLVTERMQGASIIHIAAHGDKKRGRVLLAPNPEWNSQMSANPEEKFYLLNEKDVSSIRISANLVVLCCCHTSMGKVKAEGVIGLARSFLASGARSVLATLWPIHDQATKEFMENFYSEICKETPVCMALKKTMNMFQHHPTRLYRSFHVWAPFTIFGEDVKFTQQDIEEIKRESRDVDVCHCECS